MTEQKITTYEEQKAFIERVQGMYRISLCVINGFQVASDNYDGAPDADPVNQLVGYGKTPAKAFTDYFEQLEELVACGEQPKEQANG